MQLNKKEAQPSKGFGDASPSAEQKSPACIFFGEKYLVFMENVCRTLAVKAASLAQEMQRSGMTCFASPVSGVQNRYWVNTTRIVCEGWCSVNFSRKFTEIGAANS